jgi:hypothetical protein
MMTFQEAVQAQLSKKGVLLLPDGTLRLDPHFKGAGQVSQAQVDLFNSMREVGAAHNEVELSWARDFRHTVFRVLAGDSTDPAALESVFYLRLHGWLVDFRSNRKIAFDALKEAKNPSALLRTFIPIRDALDGIVAALTEDELLYAEYRRHVEGHMQQGSYENQWNKREQAVSDRFTSKYTGKTYSRADVSKRIASLMRMSRAQSLTVELAQRVLPHVVALENAMHAWGVPDPY